MQILYVAPKYDYGKPERGYGFEHHNFYDFLERSGHDILYFDFMTLLQRKGREYLNRRLLDIARTEKPDFMFSVLFTDEFSREAIAQVSNLSHTVTLNWFCDDHWRFDNFSSQWAPCFNWAVTTARSALPKYEQLRSPNVIKSQWACNHLLYRKLDLPLLYDVTFVGQPHGNRREIVAALQKRGINVRTYGLGWDGGRVSQDEMIRVFNQSRINLNFSNASVKSGSTQGGVADKGLHWVARSLDRMPFGSAVKKAGSEVFKMVQKASPANLDTTGYADQIKGRNFEVPGCGGFMLTPPADDLETYYEIGEEVVCFSGLDDLTEKIKYYLSHENERSAIAARGYQRTVRDHTYAQRFEEIFKIIGLSAETSGPGIVQEVS
jgi:spore maturation protein CgeB